LAEETDNPRKNIPRAVFTSTLIMLVAYVLFAFSTVVGFKNNVGTLSSALIPFITVAKGVLGAALFFALLAGMTSTLGALIAGTNSQARLIFNAGREGLLPKFIGKVHDTRRTPINALFVFLGLALAIIGIWGLLHIMGSPADSASMNPVLFFAESSTFGTILVIIVYALSNLALPFYYKRFHPDLYSTFRHAVLPAIGFILIAVPLYYLARPSPPTPPYNWYPWVAAGFIVVAFIYASVLVARDPGLGERVGSIVADE
jgi:amino acid transporter